MEQSKYYQYLGLKIFFLFYKFSKQDIAAKPEACPIESEQNILLPCNRGFIQVSQLFELICCFQCSAACNGGLRRRAVECYHGYSRSTGCDVSSLPVDKERCNTDPCPAWRKGAWTKVCYCLYNKTIDSQSA